MEGGNAKALYRRAQAWLATGDFLEAELDIKAGLVEVRGVVVVCPRYRKKGLDGGSWCCSTLALHADPTPTPTPTHPPTLIHTHPSATPIHP